MPPARRRRWVMPVVVAAVAVVGIGVGVALASRDDTSAPAPATSAELADIGSMMGSMMWGDPDRMLSTCRAWSDANPSGDRPADWCESMLRGMWPHMDGDWEHWDEWMNGPMMGG